MKKIALLCVLCLFITVLPCAVSAGSDITVSVTNVAEDIITISGSVPTDEVVTIIILNPGAQVSDLFLSAGPDKIQFMDTVAGYGGVFKKDIKINTGSGQNKCEGVFTVMVSRGGEYVYFDDSFVFYSNETKQAYVSDIKNCTKQQLLETDNSGRVKIDKIFETYSFKGHPLYKKATAEILAEVICAQKSRTSLSSPEQAGDFLNKVLVLTAFVNKDTSVIKDNEINYAEVWSGDGVNANALYAERYVKELNAKGQKAVSSALLSKNFKDAQFDDIFDEFKNQMLYHLIMNNSAMGTGHIEKLVVTDFVNEYKVLGFNSALLSSITNPKEKTAKLSSFAKCGAGDIFTLAQQFNTIMAQPYKEDEGSSSQGSSGFGGGGGGGGGAPAEKAPVKNEDSGFVDENEQLPTTTPEPDAPASAYPFTDLAGATWAGEAVEYLYKEGIINGRSENTFAPNETVTRAELVKMICEALDIKDADTDVSFGDVYEGDWFAKYIKNAAAAGVVNGDGGAFRPNDEIKREDAALIIYRALGLENGGEISFVDGGEISDYAKEAVAAMVNSGYINGMGDGSFAPKATLTRAQAAQLIYNTLMKGGTAQ